MVIRKRAPAPGFVLYFDSPMHGVYVINVSVDGVQHSYKVAKYK